VRAADLESKKEDPPMADRTTEPTAAGEGRVGGHSEDRASSAVLEVPESVQGRIAAAERERDEYRELLQRTRADFENYQKRTQRDLAEERRYASAPLALELLPALDNLQRALDAASKQGDQGPLARGVAMVESQLMGVLGRFGIAPMIALNQPFDPNVHEAVLQRPRTDVPAGTVVEVLQPGYRLHERVLRPAKVAVAAAPAPEA
jgi:molecular chaperone GrpE